MSKPAELHVDSPYSLEDTVVLPYATSEELDATLNRARAAAKAFRRTPIHDRVAFCLAAIEVLEASRDAIAHDVTRTMGKPHRDAIGEVGGMSKRARHMAAIAEFSLADTHLPKQEGFVRKILREPLGVVLALPAWNYPLLTAVNVVIPAVLAGNAVILKHSPRTPLVGAHFARAFQATGAPPDLVQSILCDYPATEALAADPRVDFVSFTGSNYGGRRIYQAVANKRFIDVGLELGGKDAAYVAADADLDKAVASIVDGACYNSGQSCCAIERAFVHERLFPAFIEKARHLMAAYRMGDPLDAGTTLGPMAQPWHPPFIDAQVKQALARGAQLIHGGHITKVHDKGRFYEPTLLTEVPRDVDVMQLETFGPVLPVVAVSSDEEAITHVNDCHLGLTAAIYTSDVERAKRVARDLEVGTVYMNQCDTLDPALPWTGTKESGKGSTLSSLGFLHLTRPKALNFKVG
jgi:acyl-CoA reductase-like NAD-dependent aldehyde dehydrogenase